MTALVTLGFAAVLLLPAAGCAQERESSPNPAPAKGQNVPDSNHLYRAQDREPGAPDRKQAPEADDAKPRRLESVTWNSVNHQLTWTISQGAKESSGFKALKSDNYQISMDSATMTFNGETRRFSKEEAANVHVLMDVIAKYAVDSTVWWDEGQGEPVDGTAPKQEQKTAPTHSHAPQSLHIAWRPEAAADDAVEARIHQLEQQIERLRALQRAVREGVPLRTN